jgi:hypothetical protein
VGVGEIAGAGDFIVVPDLQAFQMLPLVEPRTAWVLGDEYLRDGSPHPPNLDTYFDSIAGVAGLVLYVSSSGRCRSQRAPQSLGSFSCC